MTAAEICDYARISYRMLDYWCRTGRVPGQAICADGSGIPRTFTVTQAKHCRVVGACTKVGLPLDVATKIAADALTGRSVHELVGGLKLFLPAALVEYEPVAAAVSAT